MKIRRPLCLVNTIFILFVYIILSVLGGVDTNEHIKDGEYLSSSGIVRDKYLKNNNKIVHVSFYGPNEPRGVLGKNFKLILYLNSSETDDLLIGQRIEFEGIFSNFNVPENEGQFDLRKYYRIRGYDGAVKNTKIVRKSKKYSIYKNTLYDVKQRTENIFYDNMPYERASTLSAMVLGDKTGLDVQVKELYQDAGIAHILSLSGLHIASVGICIYSILIFTGLGTRISSVMSLFIIASYGVMTGMSTSTLRALIMFILSIIAKNIGRTYDLLSGVCLSSVLIVLENPYYVYDSGFLLSFLSVTGIGILYPAVYRIIRLKSISVSVAASLATLPVVANSFYKVSRYGVFANLIVVPLMSVVLFMGIIAGIIGNVLFEIAPDNMVIKILLCLTGKILDLYSNVALKITDMPGSTWVIGKRSEWQIIVYAVLMISVYWINEGDIYKRITSDVKEAENTEKANRIRAFICKNIDRVLNLCVISFAVFILTVKLNYGCELNVLSVGQGACSVITGRDVPTILFDGGSSDVKEVAKYRIKPFLMSRGVDTIDYIFISHSDLDHVSGIKELLSDNNNDITVKHIVMALKDDEICSLVRNKGIRVSYMSSTDVYKTKDMKVECLNPEGINGRDLNTTDVNKNDMSLVLKVTYTGSDRVFSALFPGDISSETEKRLLDKKLESNILIAAHHGSRNSSCETFLKKVNPDICIISSGKGNSYGHPHKETLERMEETDAKVLRTDTIGQIRIKIK